MAKQIEAKIRPDGTIEIEAFGFKGRECEKVTRGLEEAMGVARSRKRKPEFYQSAEQKAEVKS